MFENSYILGLSAYYHDSAAALIRGNGEIIAAAQEERFSRKKHDAGFPARAIRYCLSEADLELSDLDGVVFYDKPLLKFDRLLETYLALAPRGFASFSLTMPLWIKDKLMLKSTLKKELGHLSTEGPSKVPPLFFTEHHHAHAGAAFFPSPYREAAVLCIDGVGEWATTSLWHGQDTNLQSVWEIRFPHSLGLFYSAFTYYTGFKVNSGEYKLMGLAPYGKPRYASIIRDHLIDLKADGSFALNMAYFNYAVGRTMTNAKFDQLFGGPPRASESPITPKEMDLARSVQVVTEEAVLRMVAAAHRDLAVPSLCLAGGVALNCVANGRLRREGPFKEVWIQPAAGDAGSALGAALIAAHQYRGQPRAHLSLGRDAMAGAYLGPRFSAAAIRQALDQLGARYQELTDDELYPLTADLLAQEQVVGWFQGRMEFGPRALGARSIIGDARSPRMQSVMNLKIKRRESFRPFAPAVLAERAGDYFELDGESPYMLLVAPVAAALRRPLSPEEESQSGLAKLKIPRSSVPAITHVDDSARIQTVHHETSPRFHRLLKAFEAKTGEGILVNTSFNVRGEPIVCTPEDAYRCFMRTEMDHLVIENFYLSKSDQPPWTDDGSWQTQFTLD